MTGAASPPRRRTGPGRSALPAIALAYLLLGLGYSLATPVGEGIDKNPRIWPTCSSCNRSGVCPFPRTPMG